MPQPGLDQPEADEAAAHALDTAGTGAIRMASDRVRGEDGHECSAPVEEDPLLEPHLRPNYMYVTPCTVSIFMRS